MGVTFHALSREIWKLLATELKGIALFRKLKFGKGFSKLLNSVALSRVLEGDWYGRDSREARGGERLSSKKSFPCAKIHWNRNHAGHASDAIILPVWLSSVCRQWGNSTVERRQKTNTQEHSLYHNLELDTY